MKSRMLATAGVAGSVVLMSAAIAYAQDAAGAPDQMPSGHGDPSQWQARRVARRQEKTEALRAVLQPRPDQEAAFQAFEQAMAPPDGESRHDRHEESANLTTPQRLDKMLSRMDQREGMFRRRAAAMKQFYAALSPQQQRAFDGLMELRGRQHGRELGGRHGETD